MAAKKQEGRHAVAPVLRVAPLGELKVYTVTEEELDTIGRGSPGSIFLNFPLTLLPLSGGFLITLLSTTIDKVATLVFFTSACIICFLGGALCLVLAWYHHSGTTKVIEKIKNRMPPPEPLPQEAVEGGTGTEKATLRKGTEAQPVAEASAPPESTQQVTPPSTPKT